MCFSNNNNYSIENMPQQPTSGESSNNKRNTQFADSTTATTQSRTHNNVQVPMDLGNELGDYSSFPRNYIDPLPILEETINGNSAETIINPSIENSVFELNDQQNFIDPIMNYQNLNNIMPPNVNGMPSDETVKLFSFINLIMKKQEEILGQLFYLRRESEIQAFRNSYDCWNEGVELDLPVTTVDEFRKFDQQLKDSKEHLNAFRRKLSNLGGRELKHQVSNAMQSVMTYKVGKKISWTGRNSEFKFSKTTTAAVIRDVIMKCHNQTKTDTEKRMGTWLQKAGDRLKASQRLA